MAQWWGPVPTPPNVNIFYLPRAGDGAYDTYTGVYTVLRGVNEVAWMSMCGYSFGFASIT